MLNLRSVQLSKKLPLFIVGFSFLIGATLIAFSLVSFQRQAFQSVQQQMSSMVADRRAAVQQLMNGIQSDLLTLGASPATGRALSAFEQTWGELDNAATDLTKAYITNNPNKTGEKHLLDRASGDQAYHTEHGIYHPGLRTLIDTKGYYDAFLISPAGDIVYSVFKEMDYATSLTTGAYKDSGLGVLFRQAAKGQAGKLYFVDMEPYAPSFGAAAAFVATPVFDTSGALLGVVALQIPVAMLGEIVNNSDGLGETTEILLVGQDGLARTTSRFEEGYQVLQSLPQSDHIGTAQAGENTYGADNTGIRGQQVAAYAAPLGLSYADWVIVAEQDIAEIMGPVTQKRNVLVMIGLGITLLMSLLGWIFARSITKPIARICENMEAIASGALDTDVTEASRGDEIGQIGKTLVSMQGDLKQARSAEEERAEQQRQQQHVVETLSAGLLRLSEGDFSQNIEEVFSREHEKLRADFNTTVRTLNETLSQVVDSASSIANGADEISQSSDDLSTRTESQAATLEETAAALEQMTVSVKSAADGASSVEKIVDEAKGEAETSGAVVKSAVAAMTEIEQSSTHISQIIGVIDDIAFQTNLLALNAGVEAARAGEAGRGFAVVASEVRALAQRSSDAALEIKALIGDSTKQVEHGVDLVGRAGDALQNIVERVGHISSLVTDIARGAVEQSTGLGEINTGVVQLDQVTQQNAAMVEEATAAGHLLKGDAAELTKLVGNFQLSGRSERAATPNSEPTVAPSAHGADDWDVELAEQPRAATGTNDAGANQWQDF
ncbi:methyl-accepting chemotaxis protein [Pseudophaeobacter sp. EL27]|uniref:methyl-accepting chemotaxis protein n=1 Tax=Pseudophaeobacter sp. EL27 TaxID=2107580 RepID=UPI000EFBA4D0|nr:methyl-accepting chemotaxis protein [Pseudophaeobacter sp. EL27]